MRREVVYRGMDAGPRVAEALDRATRHIEKQVSRFGTRAAFLRVVLDSHPVRNRFTVSARLTVRRAVLHAREERPDPVVSIRETFSELKQQLKRHMFRDDVRKADNETLPVSLVASFDELPQFMTQGKYLFGVTVHLSSKFGQYQATPLFFKQGSANRFFQLFDLSRDRRAGQV